MVSRSWPPYELVASTHYDYISANSIEGHIEIAEFNEDDLNQEIIPSGTYFTRYEKIVDISLNLSDRNLAGRLLIITRRRRKTAIS